jgi:hypothetical protein
MARPAYGGRTTCESCKSIDVRCWHREGRLRPGQYFSCSWTCGGEPSGNINVRTEANAVVLMYRSRTYGDADWKPVEQRVPIIWTACHFGGRRETPIGNPSNSEFRSSGQHATLAVVALGSYVPSILAVDTAGVVSRYCTALANCSPAGGATVWRMRASMKTCTTAASGRHRKYECNWGGARI